MSKGAAPGGSSVKRSVFPGSLAGRSAVITGAANGIGKAAARLFAEQGASVLVADIDGAAARLVAREIVATGGTASPLRADVTEKAEMEKMAAAAVKRFGRIDILCLNAGIYPRAIIEDLTEEMWDRVFAINLRGAYLATRVCVPLMKRQNYGKIVVTSSITGPVTGQAGFSHYGATKAGLLGFMRAIALEVAKYNITINAVEPGNILTEGVRNRMRSAALDEKYIIERARHIPMGRLGDPRDVAYAMLFLASDASRYITGQTIVVDGGQTLPEFQTEVNPS